MYTSDNHSREDKVPENPNRDHLCLEKNLELLLFIRLWNLSDNQPGFAMTKRGKLQANSRCRRGDLILPILLLQLLNNWGSVLVESFKYDPSFIEPSLKAPWWPQHQLNCYLVFPTSASFLQVVTEDS